MLTIAVDFDGTIVEDEYPAIGKPKLFAFETLKQLLDLNHLVILNCTRTEDELQSAVNFCLKNGIQFHAINKSYPEEVWDENISPKLSADIFISNKNIGGLPGWGEIWQQIQKLEGKASYGENINQKQPSLMQQLLNLFTRK